MNADGSLPEVRHLGDLARLRLEPGDVFVLMTPGYVSMECAERIKAQWSSVMGRECKLLVIDGGGRLGVINDGAICCEECHHGQTRTPVCG